MEPRAFVQTIDLTESALSDFVAGLRGQQDDDPSVKYLLDYPTVYIASHQGHGGTRRVYVGETSDIRSRTLQHLRGGLRVADDREVFAADAEAELYVIGHTLFNKSLTLDVENHLMHCLTSVEAVDRLYNRRTNAQSDYFTRDHFEAAFSQIWRKLRGLRPDLFPTERLVRESALFKASPFHRLTPEQLQARTDILAAVAAALDGQQRGQLILVEGAAGSGKTVLLSSLFYEMFQHDEDLLPRVDARLVVNHAEQLTVYQQIARKLGLERRDEERVTRPTRLIARTSPDDPMDVVLIDEAHLLWTQGKQSYQGQNQLLDLVDRARVVVAVFDPAQVVATNGYWEPEKLDALRAGAVRVISLSDQLRVRSSPETLAWLRALIEDGAVGPMPADPGYDLRVFDSPQALRTEIEQLSRLEDSLLSRLTATFDWPYSQGRSPADGDTWNVTIGDDFSMPWNLQTPVTRRDRGLSWAEREASIGEVGSHFTVQGFDLNYAGVILGPSVTYRDGRIVFDPAASANRHATQRRTLSDGSKRAVAEDLLRNELNILLTRGAQGLYLYAVDPALREALLEAQAARDKAGRPARGATRHPLSRR